MGKLRTAGRSCRAKGIRGELEAIKILQELTGLDLARRYGQSANSGHDCTIPTRPVICLEVKRQEELNLAAWWTQATASAVKAGGIPAVVYRRSRQPWRAIVPLTWLTGEQWPGAGLEATAVISLEAFAHKITKEVTSHEVN